MEEGIDRVRSFLDSASVEYQIKEFNESTETSYLASKLLGCTIAEIAKSVVFESDSPVVVILSGDKKVSKEKLMSITGRKAKLADEKYVKEMTGYEIGAVPPFPHKSNVKVLSDISLLRFEYVWAAAGSKKAVFRISSNDLIKLVGSGPYALSV